MDLTFVVISVIVSVALLLMWDLTRDPTCRHCPHCQRRASDEKERRRRERHERYHAYRPNKMEDCSDPNCPGRN